MKKVNYLLILLLLLCTGWLTIASADNGSSWNYTPAGKIRAGEYSVEYINNQFISFGQSSATLSTDGITWGNYWLRDTWNSYTDIHIRDVAYGNGKYAAVGTVYDSSGNWAPAGIITISDDCHEWTEVAEDLKGWIIELNGIAYGKGKFVAVGDKYGVITSTDAIKWTRNVIDQQVLNGIIYENGKFVAIGNDGVIMISEDGTLWNKIQTATSENLTDIVYGNLWYVAVGEKGTVLRSNDLNNWELVNVGTSEDINTITYGNKVFVLGGDYDVLKSSTNGKEWYDELFENNDNYRDNFSDSSYGNGKFVFTSRDAQYYTTRPLEPPTSPSNLKVTAKSSSELALAWQDHSDNESYFAIWRKGDDGKYKFLTYAEDNNFVDKGLKAATTYYYKVCAVNQYGYSTYSTSGEGTTEMLLIPIILNPIEMPNEPILITINPPKAPTNLSVETNIGASAKLSWQDEASNENAYKIERKIGGGSFIEIASINADSTSYIDYGLEYGIMYTYRVRTFNSRGYSDYSNEANITLRNLIQFQPIYVIKLPILIPPDLSTKPEEEEELLTDEEEVDENDTNQQDNVDHTEIILKIDSQNYTVNGETKELDAAPVIQNSRTIMPIRYIIEALGGTVSWDGKESKVTVKLGSDTIELWVDNPVGLVNGKEQYIDRLNPDVKPVILPPGRTMVPIRFVIESLGCDVKWLNESREVVITN